jgi:hypothetical protein
MFTLPLSLWFSGHATISAVLSIKTKCARERLQSGRVWGMKKGMARDWITEKIRIVE